MAKSGVGRRIVNGDLADNRSGHHPTFASRHLDSDRLAIATHNPGKLAEMHELLAPYGIAVISAGELGLVEPDESGMTFGENARIKAEAAAKGAGFPALADDSGLVVDALDGAPGIHSARWAGPDRNFGRAMELIDEPRWVRAFAAEIAATAARVPGRTVSTIFFGGGTPSLMRPATIAGVIEAMARHWRIAPDVEITLEANPTSVEVERF